MVNSPHDTSDSSVDDDTNVVYPSCAVMRAMAKKAQSNDNGSDCGSTQNRVGKTGGGESSVLNADSSERVNKTESPIEMADTILSHGRELENNHMPREGNSSEDPYEVVNRDQLIELQSSDDNLVTI